MLYNLNMKLISTVLSFKTLGWEFDMNTYPQGGNI